MSCPLELSEYTILDVPCNNLFIPDALPPAPIYRKVNYEGKALADDIDFKSKILPVTERRLQEIQEKALQDRVCTDFPYHLFKMDGQRNGTVRYPSSRIISLHENFQFNKAYH